MGRKPAVSRNAAVAPKRVASTSEVSKNKKVKAGSFYQDCKEVAEECSNKEAIERKKAIKAQKEIEEDNEDVNMICIS